jgi:hypothetical protein
MRNLGLMRLETDWVLHLDSDEWLSSMQLAYIRGLIDMAPPETNCIHLPRRNVRVDADWVGWPDTRPVLHRKGLLWQNRLEEWPVGNMNDIRIDDPSLAILHLQIDPTARRIAALSREEVNALAHTN